MKPYRLCALFALFTVSSLPAKGNEAAAPSGLSTDDWSSIREAHQEWRHRFVEEADGIHRAANPGQQWNSAFDGRGFAAEPRHGAWRWGLELRGYGIGDRFVEVSGKAHAEVEGERLRYRWDEVLEEWFVNDRRGLEQGWTLSERPGGNGEGEGPLRLELTVRGELLATGEGTDISFVDGEGKAVLRYGGLKAWDAKGRILPARLVGRGGELVVEVDEEGAAYPVMIDPIAQQAYLKADNADADDAFGFSVAVSGDTVVVGAIAEDSSATGVNGDGTCNCADESGAAYVFVRGPSGWAQQAYLKASNSDWGAFFGWSVAISGNTAVVGSPMESCGEAASGAAYVFVRSGTNWSEQAYLKADNAGLGDFLGWSVAVDGDIAVFGAPGEASAANTVDGDGTDNCAEFAGAAYVFTRSGEAWSQQAYLKASNTAEFASFGTSVSVSGRTVLVGAHGESSVAEGSGAAYVFVEGMGGWSEQAYLKASNAGEQDGFGRAVSLSGDTAVVGAIGESSDAAGIDGDGSNDSLSASGAAYVFVRTGTLWSEQAYLKASSPGIGDQFGGAVSISGDVVVVGAAYEDSSARGVDGDQSDDSLDLAGAAYVYLREGSAWRQWAYLKASNTGEYDNFGSSVAVSGGLLVVGAIGESSDTRQVNGKGENDDSLFSGAAYVFELEFPSSLVKGRAPTVRIAGARRVRTSRPFHNVKGTASDPDGDLVRVEIRNSRRSGTGRAQGTTNWRFRAPLRKGSNVLSVRAVDAEGRRSATAQVTLVRKAQSFRGTGAGSPRFPRR